MVGGRRHRLLGRATVWRHDGRIVVAVVSFVVAGALAVQGGGAATYVAGVEAESGTVTGNAAKLAMDGAAGAGGTAVRFNAPSSGGSGLRLGVFKDGACALADPCAARNGPAGNDQYAAWLGRTMMVGEDNAGDESGGNTWTYFENGWPDSFSQWRAWKQRVPGRQLALAVPMFLQFEPGDNTQQLTACAQGAYDARYRALASNLADNGLGDTIMRIGWEAHFDGAMPWSYFHNPTDWKPCWRRIATQMKSVAPDLVMNWNMGDGEAMRAAVNLRGFDNFYPGDDVVDELGIDTYDVNGLNQDYDAYFGTGVGGLGWWVQQAAARNKRISFPEWGLWDNRTLTFGGGSRDDVGYIERMHAFMTDPANRVSWAAYFDYNVGDYPMHQLQPGWGSGTVFPNASARFRQLFGAP